MGIIANDNNERVPLLTEHLFGRAKACDTSLTGADVSSRHATIGYDGARWLLRDLGSTNGTFHNGQRLGSGESAVLGRGDTIQFAESEQWRLVQEEAPTPMALAVDSAAVAIGDESLVLIPNAEAPVASLALERGTRWVLEHATSLTPLDDGALFTVDGQVWRFHAAAGRVRTVQLGAGSRRLSDVTLRFQVSTDEEHVQLTAELRGQSFDLKARTHHYTLLSLARLRQRDAADPSLPESSHGWVDTQEFARQLGASETKLSVEVCRIRQQLSVLELDDAADVIERRPQARQLRIGAAQVVIERV